MTAYSVNPAVIEGVGVVRPFVQADIPRIVALRQRLFRLSERETTEKLATYFDAVFFANPLADPEIPSVVYESVEGLLTGFVGLIPRRMYFGSERIRVAVATQLMVAPENQGLGIGRRLGRAMTMGAQALTFSDLANASAHRIWDSIGGQTALIQSLFWMKSLRPVRHFVGRQARGPVSRALSFASRPFAGAVDNLSTRARLGLDADHARDSVQSMQMTDVLPPLEDILKRWQLRPCYERAPLQWVLDQFADRRGYEGMEQAMVRDERANLVGWFLYLRNAGGVSEVIQVVARRADYRRVLQQLFRHAHDTGAVAVAGRLDAAVMDALAGLGCVFSRDGPWTCFHTRSAEIATAIGRGDCMLSRIEGEWWMSF